MLLLGIDLGTSSIKVSVVDAATQRCLAAAQYPEEEVSITSLEAGWAEQSPDLWWEHTRQAIRKVHAQGKYDPSDIGAIGIAYQMHGLVIIDKEQNVLRDSIIWCDSRAVPYGNAAFEYIGADVCLPCLLNSPGNFTASKLAWVKEHEPHLYERIDKVLLPGDFIAMRLTGNTTTSVSALSEGVLWNFSRDEISKEVLDYYGFDEKLFPHVQEVFAEHGLLKASVAEPLGLPAGIPVTYKAGDQPNNALSLNVLNPGEVAATAGTSGVIYGVSDALTYDPLSRVNSFAHVNYTAAQKRIGVLLCINGAGITNRWIRSLVGGIGGYDELNTAIEKVPAGSDGLVVLPFGNGAERMLQNRLLGAHVSSIDFNKHTAAHFYRAGQEGVAYAFRYGLDIMRENGMSPSVIRAGRANMFLSDVFTGTFVNACGVPVELYKNDGSVGAALGAGIGAGIYTTAQEAFLQLKPLKRIDVTNTSAQEELYQRWKEELSNRLNKTGMVPSEYDEVLTSL
jgi:xylulokinase